MSPYKNKYIKQMSPDKKKKKLLYGKSFLEIYSN